MPSIALVQLLIPGVLALWKPAAIFLCTLTDSGYKMWKLKAGIDSMDNNLNTRLDIWIWKSIQRSYIIDCTASKISKCACQSSIWCDVAIWNRRELIISTSSSALCFISMSILVFFLLAHCICDIREKNVMHTWKWIKCHAIRLVE